MYLPTRSLRSITFAALRFLPSLNGTALPTIVPDDAEPLVGSSIASVPLSHETDAGPVASLGQTGLTGVLLNSTSEPDMAAVESMSEPAVVDTDDTLKHYYDNGDYQRELQVVGSEAITYLTNLPRYNGLGAVVFDIDETCLMNRQDLINPYHPYNRGGWVEWLGEGNALAIQPALDLYNKALELGYIVFFITGRRAKYKEVTEANMRRAGFAGWEEIFFRPSDPGFPSAVAYKSATREYLINAGYEIVLNIGDQHSDLEGGFATKTFKLPNPFYTIE